MIKLQINNKDIIIPASKRIIEITDDLKIPIPRLCYHRELTVTAHCNLCLIEVVGVSKLLPACSTIAEAGMHIFTSSPRILEHRKEVIASFLNNHPLDCPVCEKHGECELQDLTFLYGADRSLLQQHNLNKNVHSLNLGPLISMKSNRCIYCTRCIRFGEEIAGNKQLELTKQNNQIAVINYYDYEIISEVSGNMVDLCPTGALYFNAIEARFNSWELNLKFGISSHDCLGSNINYHIDYKGEIKRAVPMKNIAINDMWLSDRDRLGFLGINSPERLKYPLLKKDNRWYIATWDEAFTLISLKLNKIINKYGPKQIGGLISPNATLEEGMIFQLLLRSLGTNNIDHRLRQTDFRETAGSLCYPYLNLKNIAELKIQQVIILIGSYINHEQPIAGIYLREAIRHNCKVIVINPIDFSLGFTPDLKLIPPKGDLMKELLSLIHALNLLKPDLFQDKIIHFFPELEHNEVYLNIANMLLNHDPTKITIILGDLAITHPDYTNLVAGAKLITDLLGLNFGCLSQGANSLGLYLVECLPSFNVKVKLGNKLISTDATGLNTSDLLRKALKGYILYGIEPELDSSYGAWALNVLTAADFVVSFTAFESAGLMKYSDVLLPVTLPAESGGSYINVTGELQQFAAIAQKPGESDDGFKLMLKLSQYLRIDLIESKILEEIILKVKNFPEIYMQQKFSLKNPFNLRKSSGLIKISPLWIYASDPVVRRSKALQQATNFKSEALINPQDAVNLNILPHQYGSIKCLNDNFNYCNESTLKSWQIKISHQVPPGCILIKQINLNSIIGLPYQLLSLEIATSEAT